MSMKITKLLLIIGPFFLCWAPKTTFFFCDKAICVHFILLHFIFVTFGVLSWCTMMEWHRNQTSCNFYCKHISWHIYKLNLISEMKLEGTCLCSKLQNVLLFWIWNMLKINCLFLTSRTSHRKPIEILL